MELHWAQEEAPKGSRGWRIGRQYASTPHQTRGFGEHHEFHMVKMSLAIIFVDTITVAAIVYPVAITDMVCGHHFCGSYCLFCGHH